MSADRERAVDIRVDELERFVATISGQGEGRSLPARQGSQIGSAL